MGAKLISPRIVVRREGKADLDLQTTTPDLIRWETTSVRHKWPSFEVGPIKWMTFIAWAAARRTDQIPADLTYEAWEAEIVDIAPYDDEDDDAVRPTRPDPEAD